MIELIKIYTAHFPKEGFTALTIVPFIFVRKDRKDKFVDFAEWHETTHALQQIEVGIIGIILTIVFLLAGFGWWSLICLPLFFELYCLEWMIKLPFCKFDTKRAYMSISTEQEAYGHQDDSIYNSTRRHFAWIKYIFTIKN